MGYFLMIRVLVLLCLVGGTLARADKGEHEGRDDRKSAMGRIASDKIAQFANRVPPGSARCVNTPDCGDEDLPLGLTQSETSLAVDSTGRHVVVGFNDFRGLISATTVSVSGFMYSDDGGATFVDGGQLPTGPTTVRFNQRFPQIFGDPDVKYLGGCNFVYSSIMLATFGGT